MNLEEAKANIGKEVIYIGNDRELIDNVFNDKKLIICEPTKRRALDVLIEYDDLCFWNIPPQDLKLKEQPMNYKIKVTPETSAEVQELFFELGYRWSTQDNASQEPKYTDSREYIFAYQENMRLTAPYLDLRRFESRANQEITLPQLRDMVVLKRNDVSDTTHTGNVSKFYVGDSKVYQYHDNNWIECNILEANLKKIKKQELEMTWQDALRAMADGKEVQYWNNLTKLWYTLNHHDTWSVYELSQEKLRLKPTSIHIEGGDYTKEELLKIAGEMY